MLLSLVLFVGLILIFIWNYCKKSTIIGLRPLPGPKGLPIIGSVHEVPESLNWIKFSDWGKQYGPIYQVNLAGQNHVWVSKDSIAKELLSKKASIYSDRPHIPALLDDNRDSGQYLPLMSRNELWSRQRKFANHIMRNSENAAFYGYPELESIRLCHELIQDPTNYNTHLESFVSRVTCRLAWGRSEGSDELKQRARELLISVSPTGSFANKLPFLMSLPSWMSRTKAWELRRARTERKWFEVMQGHVEKDIAKDSAAPSWTKMFLDAPKAFNFSGHVEGAYAVGMHGIAGALTIAAPMQAFCLAICYYPQYLPLLQEELDRVCPDRLPTYNDRAELPVLRSFIREVLRWRPPVPTGIPHCSTQDDEYNGHHIPKGSIIHPLEWAISRDPEQFPDPESFNPLRWLKPGYPTYQEPLSQHPSLRNITQYGYGQRTCQGQAVAEADLIVACGALAWLFEIRLPVTEPQRGLNAKPFMSDEDRFQGLENNLCRDDDEISISSDDEDVPSTGYSVIDNIERLRRKAIHKIKMDWKQKDQKLKLEQDPTLIYTKLLIAKPLPFKFDLQVRNCRRAEMIQELFQKHKAEGDFVDSAEYWGESHGQGKEFGWVKV